MRKGDRVAAINLGTDAQVDVDLVEIPSVRLDKVDPATWVSQLSEWHWRYDGAVGADDDGEEADDGSSSGPGILSFGCSSAPAGVPLFGLFAAVAAGLGRRRR